MAALKGLSRALSHEESQNNQNEDLEMDAKQTSPSINTEPPWSNSGAVPIDIDKGLLNSHGAKKQKKWGKRKNFKTSKVWLCVKNIVKGVFALAVIWLSCMEVRRFLSTEDLIQTNTHHDTHSDRPSPVAVSQKQNSEVTDKHYPEEYKVDTQRLRNEKDLHWVPVTGNSQTLSKPALSGCIELLMGGKYKIFNSITLRYKNQKNLYHLVARQRAQTAGLSKGFHFMVVKKANFQWETPQTGRQPSTLQFLVEVEPGDQLCVQTNSIGMIYPSIYDNIFLIEKL